MTTFEVKSGVLYLEQPVKQKLDEFIANNPDASFGEVAEHLGIDKFDGVNEDSTFSFTVAVKPAEAATAQGAIHKFAVAANNPVVDKAATVMMVRGVRGKENGLTVLEGVLPSGELFSFAVSDALFNKLPQQEGMPIAVYMETRVPGKTTWKGVRPEILKEAVDANAKIHKNSKGEQYVHVLHADDLKVTRVVSWVDQTNVSLEDWAKLQAVAAQRLAMQLAAEKPVQTFKLAVEAIMEVDPTLSRADAMQMALRTLG